MGNVCLVEISQGSLHKLGVLVWGDLLVDRLGELLLDRLGDLLVDWLSELLLDRLGELLLDRLGELLVGRLGDTSWLLVHLLLLNLPWVGVATWGSSVHRLLSVARLGLSLDVHGRLVLALDVMHLGGVVQIGLAMSSSLHGTDDADNRDNHTNAAGDRQNDI